MPSKSSANEIDFLAAQWAVRLDAESLTKDEEIALDEWLHADSRHLGAFAKARAILVSEDDELEALRAAQEGLGVSSRRTWLLRSMAAAAVLAVTGGGRLLWLAAVPGYATDIGETRVISLADGSVITLNTNSAVSVNYTRDRREVRLDRGEVLFDVAKNKRRPFIVVAGFTQVRAVGTSFVVKILPSQPVEVLVREGVVEVKRPDVPVAAPVRVVANTKVVAPVNAPIETRAVPDEEVKRALAWQIGRIAFHGETLREAATEFARYSDIQIVIDDPAVAEQTVTGMFVSNDPVGFARGVAYSLNLRAEVGDKEVRLTR